MSLVAHALVIRSIAKRIEKIRKRLGGTATDLQQHPQNPQLLSMGVYWFQLGIPVDRDRSFRFIVTGDSGLS